MVNWQNVMKAMNEDDAERFRAELEQATAGERNTKVSFQRTPEPTWIMGSMDAYWYDLTYEIGDTLLHIAARNGREKVLEVCRTLEIEDDDVLPQEGSGQPYGKIAVASRKTVVLEA
jgi:hypothetical protein|mmetsp:Transcript_3125/g.5971  ORF Transcript_3125/g.5971 Transcript_3125/m.5971 type:complete len:117 (+) Transcript_3125:27-377(+)